VLARKYRRCKFWESHNPKVGSTVRVRHPQTPRVGENAGQHQKRTRFCAMEVSLASPSPLNQCVVNVPQGLHGHGFYEVFEGTSGPSVRANVVGKRLIHYGEQ